MDSQISYDSNLSMSGGRRGKKYNRKGKYTRKNKKMSGGFGLALGAIVKDALVPLGLTMGLLSLNKRTKLGKKNKTKKSKKSKKSKK
jgi:hypothetical protein